jgi:hypothetical protein
MVWQRILAAVSAIHRIACFALVRAPFGAQKARTVDITGFCQEILPDPNGGGKFKRFATNVVWVL